MYKCIYLTDYIAKKMKRNKKTKTKINKQDRITKKLPITQQSVRLCKPRNHIASFVIDSHNYPFLR